MTLNLKRHVLGRLLFIYLVIVFIPILIGCSGNVAKGETQIPTSIPAIETIPNDISTTDIRATLTQPPADNLTPIATTIPFQPISTPSAKEGAEITLNLLRTNNGCDLPCWWGVIPNQTSWDDAKNFLKPFSTIYERQPPSEWFVYDVHSPLPIEFSDVSAVRTVYATQQGIVKEIETGYFDEQAYHLSSFLLKYGLPGQVFVSTYSSDYGLPSNKVPLSVDLYYPERGINALYGTYASVEGEKIIGCFSKSPSLFLWSPSEHHRSIDYILGWDKNRIPYEGIKHATGIDVQEFHEVVAKLENEPCLETPTNLWPAQ